MELRREQLERFAGLEIAGIHIVPYNVFDSSRLWFVRAANSMHTITREQVIRKDLLFKKGDKVDPDVLIRTGQLVISRPYISDVNITVFPNAADSTMVDIYVVTRDKWSISADAGIDGDNDAYLKIFDDNFLGSGNSLGITTNSNVRTWKYGGNMFEYRMPNMFGTFFSGRIVAGKDFDTYSYGLESNREFVQPGIYAGGFSFFHEKSEFYLRNGDTTINSSYNTYDIWGGKSWPIKSLNNSVFFTARYAGRDYTDRPQVSASFNPAFHNERSVLASVGLYRENFRIANLIYGYGVSEYIAYGYQFSLTGGYSWREFGNRWYLGGDFSTGYFTKIGYFGWRMGLGSYINNRESSFYMTTMTSSINYFSNLLGKGRYKVRQFISLGGVRGWNRLEGYHEYVKFDRKQEMQALRRDAYGANKLTLGTETVVFTPWNIVEFKFAPFFFVDAGFIGENGNFFKNDFYTTFGFGVRIKNESMIFNTINIRIGFAVNKTGFIPSNYFAVSSADRMSPARYVPQKASVIEYR